MLPRARCLNTCLRHQILQRILNQGKGGSFQLGGLSVDALYQSFPLYRVDLFFSPQLRIVEQNHTTTPSFGLYWLRDSNRIEARERHYKLQNKPYLALPTNLVLQENNQKEDSSTVKETIKYQRDRCTLLILLQGNN